MDDFQTTCFSLTTTISTTKTDCGLDSFGKTSDCCTTYKFSNFSRAGICTEKVEHFSRLNTTTKMVLAKWVFDSLTILSAFVIIVNLMI